MTMMSITRTASVGVGWLLLMGAIAIGQADGKKAADTTAPGITGIVAAGAKIHLLETWDPARGGEGPVAAADGGLLFVQDEPFRVVKIDPHGIFSTFIDTKGNRILGLAYDRKGRLIGTQRGPAALVALTPTPSVLADSFEGKPLGSPNDLVIDAKGGLYFTDPAPRQGPGQPPLPGAKSYVFYVTPAGQLQKASEEVGRPNGIELSPDGKTLYVVNSADVSLMAFDVQSDASLRNPRKFVSSKGADGLAVDAAGDVYAAADDGVEVFSPAGRLLGTIAIPLKPRNVAFSGPNRKTLFVVSRGAAYTIAMLAEGPKGRAK
jgi:gluconolactonase